MFQFFLIMWTFLWFLHIGFAVIYYILGSYLLKYRLYNEFFSQLTVQLKIIIATLQIVASSSYVLSVDYPDYFTSFAEILAVMLTSRAMILKWRYWSWNWACNYLFPSVNTLLMFIWRPLMSISCQSFVSSAPFVWGKQHGAFYNQFLTFC